MNYGYIYIFDDNLFWFWGDIIVFNWVLMCGYFKIVYCDGCGFNSCWFYWMCDGGVWFGDVDFVFWWDVGEFYRIGCFGCFWLVYDWLMWWCYCDWGWFIDGFR